MRIIDRREIDELEKRFRANLINSISGYKSANLIATIDGKLRKNLAVFSSVVHVGAHPPLLGLVMRPIHVERHTYSNILETGHYTLNALPYDLRQEGHLTSAKFSRDESEFEKSGLTPTDEGDYPPFVEESPIGILCVLRSDLPIEVNGTRFLVGEILRLRIHEQYLGSDGYYDIQSAGVAAISGLDGYHRGIDRERFSYARENEPLQKI
jgi:flavin reductase (DIM6/NTAB) family NADH-FMN oxidoreductase RutF